MKILVVCQYYYPEPFRITDICEELVNMGNQVTVITGVPNYPMGKIYEGYNKGQKRKEIINGVNVIRCFTIGRRNGMLYRMLNYFSYMISSSVCASKIKEKYDVVFVNQLSPVMMANAGIKYKKKNKKKMVLYCLDLWPASLLVGGIKKNSYIYRLFYNISKKMYVKADEILVTSSMFKEYLTNEFQISAEKISYLPQYAENIFSVQSCQKKDNGTIDLMFAGNIGVAQNVEIIIAAAMKTKDIKNLRFHIVGDGTNLLLCKKNAEKAGLENVFFYGRRELNEMPQYYTMADAMVVTMKKTPIISMTLPGKVQTYMAAGKPIIASGDGELVRTINQSGCGFTSEAENVERLSENIRKFAELQEAERQEMGHASRTFYEKNFSKSFFMSCLIECMEKNV